MPRNTGFPALFYAEAPGKPVFRGPRVDAKRKSGSADLVPVIQVDQADLVRVIQRLKARTGIRKTR